MRAKRSKKYRKVMNQYGLAFGFREPYQVLVDANFLYALHAYKMDLVPALERTLQGKVKPMITKCTLSHLLATQFTAPSTAQKSVTKTTDPVTGTTTTRPSYLPPPTILPLRHCPHTQALPEPQCLLSLLANTSDSKTSAPTKQKPNKQHYILATSSLTSPSDSGAAEQEGGSSTQRLARDIPGVPIMYLKRSVLILEPLSVASEGVRRGEERGKLKGGILGKRRRGSNQGVDGGSNAGLARGEGEEEEGGGGGGGKRDGEHKRKRKKEYGFHKAKKDVGKGVNAPSMPKTKEKGEKKSRRREDENGEEWGGIQDSPRSGGAVEAAENAGEEGRRKRIRKHKKGDGDVETNGGEIET